MKMIVVIMIMMLMMMMLKMVLIMIMVVMIMMMVVMMMMMMMMMIVEIVIHMIYDYEQWCKCVHDDYEYIIYNIINDCLPPVLFVAVTLRPDLISNVLEIVWL